ncbi:hypothetical protein Syun_004968 [Stephania yunnanensis]|uniref:Pentatricopeptide repeat-containing protein n=1 Tax=Stephania yunnanensis TaxID=152371 RepID=A0AAP0Q5G5_9MAGN
MLMPWRFVFSISSFRATTLRHFSSTPLANNRISQYLRRASLIDSIRLALRSPNTHQSLLLLLQNPTLDPFVATHAIRSAPSPQSALALFDSFKTLHGFSPNQTLLHAIAKTLAKARRIDELRNLIAAINGGEFNNVARVTSMDLLRWYALAGDLELVLQVWREYRLGANRACTESYNTVMEVYAKKGKNLEAVTVFSRMIDEGANPNSRTFTVLIVHLASFGNVDGAVKVFEMLPRLRVKRTLKQYSVLAEILTRAKQFDLVKTLLDEMKGDGVLPCNSMRLSLNCMRDAGYVVETEELLKDFSPDMRIGNVGIPVDSGDDDDDYDVDGSQVVGNGDQVQLKPWLDPSALATALKDWSPGEVRALEGARFVWTTRLVCKVLRSFKDAETAWKFFCWVAQQPGDFSHDVYTVSRMITILARHGRVELVDQLISKVKREGIMLSFSTVRLMIDFFGYSKKADAALRIFRDVQVFCGPICKDNLVLLYSSLLRTFAKCKRGLDALELLKEMMSFEIYPDIQTCTRLMQYFASEGDLRVVQNLLGIVRQSGIKPDAYMFQILIHAYCKHERAALAMRVFEDMGNSGLVPDMATKELLVKSLWREGKLREAAAVEERCEEINGILPLALPGHVWTVSSADLARVYDIYSRSFSTDDANIQTE